MNASSSACVGCSCVPSPALTTQRPHPAAVGQPVRRARRAVPDHDRVGAHRLQRQRGVLEALALRHARALGREVDDVGAESRLAAASNEIRVRVESSKKRLTTVRPRRVGQLLDRPVGERAQLGGGVEDRRARRRGSGRRRRADGASCGTPSRCRSAAMITHGVRAVSGRRSRLEASTCDALGQRGREVLADEVGADRQLAVPAVDEHGELDRPGPADVVERVERGPDGAAAEEHVVDEHDDGVVDAARPGCRWLRARGRAASAGRRGTW